MFNLVRVGKEWAGPVFPHPLKKQRLHVYFWQGKVGCVFPRQFTIWTIVFPHPITFWTRLILNLVRVGKEWAGPVFPHPLNSKGYMCIRDRVRLAVFFPDNLPYDIWTTVFPHPITFWTRLILTLVRVGKNGPAQFFPTPRLMLISMFTPVSMEKKWASTVFPQP